MNQVFDYYQLKLKLREPMLGTNASADIMKEFVISKAKTQIEEANRCTAKISKALKKFQGEQISESKETEELRGIVRSQQELLGIKEDIPTTVEAIVVYSKELELKLDDKLKEQEDYKSTVFLRDEDGRPAISSHMLLGQIKAVLSTVINSGNKSIFKSKVQLNECSALDLKFVETLLPSSEDIMRDENGDRDLNIRPIRFNRMGQTISALAASEQLPRGTEFMVTLRVRYDSPLNNIETLKYIFMHGKNLGLGAWRNSNQFGTFDFKLDHLKKYIEPALSDGWE